MKLSHRSLYIQVMMESKHPVQHTPSTAHTEYSIHRVQPTPSTTYPKYSIHQVQHTLSMAYTVHCIISRSSVSRCPPVSHLLADHVVHDSLHSHIYKLTKEYRLSSHCPSLLNYLLQIERLQGLLQSRLMMACRCISNLAQSQPSNVSRNLQNYILQFRMTMVSKCISKLAWSQHTSVSPISFNSGLQTSSIMASECIPKFTQSRPPSASPNKLR